MVLGASFGLCENCRKQFSNAEEQKCSASAIGEHSWIFPKSRSEFRRIRATLAQEEKPKDN